MIGNLKTNKTKLSYLNMSNEPPLTMYQYTIIVIFVLYWLHSKFL